MQLLMQYPWKRGISFFLKRYKYHTTNMYTFRADMFYIINTTFKADQPDRADTAHGAIESLSIFTKKKNWKN